MAHLELRLLSRPRPEDSDRSWTPHCAGNPVVRDVAARPTAFGLLRRTPPATTLDSVPGGGRGVCERAVCAVQTATGRQGGLRSGISTGTLSNKLSNKVNPNFAPSPQNVIAFNWCRPGRRLTHLAWHITGQWHV